MTRSLLFALLAVLLYVLAFPPVDAGALGFVALAPWCVLARRERGWRLFLIGTLTGAAILAIGCAWIRRTHPVNLALMVVPESLFFGGFALLLRALHVTRGVRALVALPLAFTGVELVRGRWPLDGFPWLSFGYTQHELLEVVQLSALTGVHGVTFLLAACAGALVDAAAPGLAPTRRLAPLAPGAALLLATAIGGRLALGDPAALPAGPRLLVVQPGFEQRLKDDAARTDVMLARHFELADAQLAREPADIVVWSETMLGVWWPVSGEQHPDDPPGLLDARAFVRRELDRHLFRRHRLPLLAGAVTYDGAATDPFATRRNTALLFDAAGRRVATYDKKVLVPGGEYLPWIDALPDSLADAIRRLVLEMAGFPPNLAPGVRPGIFDLAEVGAHGRAGLTICFEFAYPHLGRELVANGADFLVNLSNEAWFPDSAEFEQAVAMSVFRAAEIRRSVVRCANSGTSGLIDPWGRATLLEKDGRRDGFAGAMTVSPPIHDATTPYARFGEWVGAGSWLATAVLLLLRRRTAAVARP